MSNGKKWRSSQNMKQIRKILSEYNEIIFFDTETTGFSKTDYIIELAALKYTKDNNRRFFESYRLHLYMKPPFSIPEKIVEITDITDEFLEDKPCEKEVFNDIRNFFGEAPVIIAHNVGFDDKMLSSLYERQGETFKASHKIDTLEMARDCISKDETENYKLETLATLFGLNENVAFHSAIDDIIVTEKLFVILLREYMRKPVDTRTDLMKPIINSIHFWPGYKGFAKIYVNTDIDSFFYDVRQHYWGAKNYDIDLIDMEYLQATAMSKVGVETLDAFAQFKGDIDLTA